MSCPTWKESLAGRLYGELTPAEDASLSAHLDGCGACRATLEGFERVRQLMRDDEPEIPRVPRVIVLRERSRFRPALLAASMLGAAVLAGTGAGLFAARARGTGPESATIASGKPAETAVSTEEAVRREVDRRLAAWEASHPGGAPIGDSGLAAASSKADPPVSASALRAELAKFERRLNGARASDLDYMLGQIAASEDRVGSRLGKTNDALRTVALASNPYPNEQ